MHREKQNSHQLCFYNLYALVLGYGLGESLLVHWLLVELVYDLHFLARDSSISVFVCQERDQLIDVFPVRGLLHTVMQLLELFLADRAISV